MQLLEVGYKVHIKKYKKERFGGYYGKHKKGYKKRFI